MRKVAILTFLTLDGVIQGPSGPDEDPSGGFTHGGWAAGHWAEVMEQVQHEAMAEPYDLLLGRKTYEIFASSFSHAKPEEADSVTTKLNNATKYVATSTLSELEWKNSIRISGDIATEVARLKEQDGPLLQIHGSGQLIRTLLAHDLIDELRLWIFPVVVGSGRRLFGNDGAPKALLLVKSHPTSNGALMCIYKRTSENGGRS